MVQVANAWRISLLPPPSLHCPHPILAMGDSRCALHSNANLSERRQRRCSCPRCLSFRPHLSLHLVSSLACQDSRTRRLLPGGSAMRYDGAHPCRLPSQHCAGRLPPASIPESATCAQDASSARRAPLTRICTRARPERSCLLLVPPACDTDLDGMPPKASGRGRGRRGGREMGCSRAGQRTRRSAHLPPREVGRRWRQRRGHAFFPQLIFECVCSAVCVLGQAACCRVPV